MADEVDPAVQAQMAIKLAENVRQLIRDEMFAALNDPTWVSKLTTMPDFSDKVLQGFSYSCTFEAVVLKTFVDGMKKRLY